MLLGNSVVEMKDGPDEDGFNVKPALGEKLWQSGVKTNCVLFERRLDRIFTKKYQPEILQDEDFDKSTEYKSSNFGENTEFHNRSSNFTEK